MSVSSSARPGVLDAVSLTFSEHGTMSRPMADTPKRRPRRRSDDDLESQTVRFVADERKRAALQIQEKRERLLALDRHGVLPPAWCTTCPTM